MIHTVEDKANQDFQGHRVLRILTSLPTMGMFNRHRFSYQSLHNAALRQFIVTQ